MSPDQALSPDILFQHRKEQVVRFIQAKKDYIILSVILFLSLFIRSQNIPHLIDITTGRPITLELDSTLFGRYAQYIAEHGSLFSTDPFRNYPLGADISIGVFTSYFIAYLYKFLHFFIPSITVEYVTNIYPLVSIAILTLFFFLLVRRLFDYRVALLASAFLNFMPAFLFRSLGGSSDHDILGIMFIFLAFYLYVVGFQSSHKKYIILFGSLAALSTLFGISSAGSAAFIFITIALFNLAELFLTKFDTKNYILLTSFTITLTLFWSFFVSTPYAVLFSSLSTGIIYFSFFVASAYYLLQKPSVKHFLSRIPRFHSLPLGIQSFLITFVFFTILGMIFYGPSFILAKFQQISDEVLKTNTRFAVNRWILTVAENKRPYIVDWLGQYGRSFVYAALLGSVFLFYRLIKHLSRAPYLTGVYCFFLFGYVFSRYSSSSILNGDNTLSHFLFYSATLLFFALVIGGYFYSYYRNHDIYEKIRTIDKRYTFLFILFFVQILAATSAIRLLFEFSPVVCILAAFFFITLFDYALLLQQHYLRYIALGMIILFLVSPFSFARGILYEQYQTSLSQARGSGPGYNQQWQYAGKWARDNTPANAVFAHWWDYGYWVQSGFQRPTITDGGNFIAWWNYLMGREVLTARNDTEPLKFLYSHNASYLLMVQEDIGKYGAYSSIGSDIHYDRFSYIPTLMLDPQNSQEKRNQTILFYQGGFALDEDLLLNGKVYPGGAAGIGGIFLPIERVTNASQGSQLVQQPLVALIHQNQRTDLRLQCVFIGETLYEFPTYDLPGCLRIIPTISNNQVNPLGSALYLSRRTYPSLFAQLYLLNKKSPYFALAYDDISSMPLAIYEGRLIGPIRIWKISYPSLTFTPAETAYYSSTSYNNNALTRV